MFFLLREAGKGARTPTWPLYPRLLPNADRDAKEGLFGFIEEIGKRDGDDFVQIVSR